MAFYGYCAQEHRGKIFLHDIHRTKHAIDASSNGSKKVFSDVLPLSWSKTYTNAAALIFAKRS
jgi:hypothetical protein